MWACKHSATPINSYITSFTSRVVCLNPGSSEAVGGANEEEEESEPKEKEKKMSRKELKKLKKQVTA